MAFVDILFSIQPVKVPGTGGALAGLLLASGGDDGGGEGGAEEDIVRGGGWRDGGDRYGD